MVLGETAHLKSEDLLSLKLPVKFGAPCARFRLPSEGRASQSVSKLQIVATVCMGPVCPPLHIVFRTNEN